MAAPRGRSTAGEEKDDDDDESAVMDRAMTELVKMPSSLSEGPASNLLHSVLSDSREVLEALPSHALSMALRPRRGECFTVELPTAALWEQTMGRLLRPGRWFYEDQRKLSARYAAGLKRQLAVLHTQAQPCINSCFLQEAAPVDALAQRQSGTSSARCPTSSSESSGSGSSSSSNTPDFKAGPEDEDPPDNVSTRVGGVYHETLAVHIPPRSSVPLLGSLVGTCWLHVRTDRRSEELVSSCVLQVFGEGRGALPTFVAGRHGRVDTPGKAQQLFELIRFAVGQSRPRRELRVRILSLLNALVVDRQERTFFQNQLSVLAAPSSDFAKAMNSLGADFACLNLVANWPLGLRLGSGPPCGQHNALHPRGLQRHLQWLAQDVLDALGGSSIRDYRGPLREISEGRSGLDPWRDGLPAVQAAIAVLKSRGAKRQECCRLFMAAELLAQLCKCEGTTFRRRAAELLQLCLLEHLLGVVPFFNCKSGMDRTGLVVALWTTVEQLLVSTQLWLWYYLALTYPVLVKVVHGLHGCGDRDARGRRVVPSQQLREGCVLRGMASLLPYPPEDGELYADVERLCGLAAGQVMPDVESRTYEVLERLFFHGPDALLPRLQAGFLANVLGVATKIVVASTGVHGLKYGENKSGQCNALAAQFMPRRLCCGEGNLGVEIAAPRKGLVATDVAFTAEALPYIVGSSVGRGT